MTDHTLTLHAISSMATQLLLADLSKRYTAQTGVRVNIESVGGVDAAKRIQAGEAFDAVLLAAEAIDQLIASGHVLAGSRCDWVNSCVAVAVRADAPAPRIGTEQELLAAVLSATTLSYSTGPSGKYLQSLFQRWGIADTLQARTVIPPPGTPVARLLAQGKAELGFQQRSELIHQDGIQLIGDLPQEVAYVTTFSAGIGLAGASDATRKQAVQDFFDFLAAPEQQDAKRAHGMLSL